MAFHGDFHAGRSSDGYQRPRPAQRAKPARPAMLRRVLLVGVIAIVVWMGYSFGVDRGLWRAWKHSAANAASAPNSSTPIAPAATPSP